MPDNDRLKIQLKVADKVFPIFCERSEDGFEEGLFRKAATAINDKIRQYSSRFSGKRLEGNELLAMTAIHFSAVSLLLRQKEDTSPLMEKIKLLDTELEEYLQSSE